MLQKSLVADLLRWRVNVSLKLHLNFESQEARYNIRQFEHIVIDQATFELELLLNFLLFTSYHSSASTRGHRGRTEHTGSSHT